MTTPGGQEHIGAIIEVKYIGQEAIDRYIRDLERLGRITGTQATGLREIWQANAQGILGARDAVLELSNALNLTGSARSGLLQIAADASTAERRTDAVTASVRRLDQALQQAAVSRRALAGAGPERVFAEVRKIPVLTIEVLKGSDPQVVWGQLQPALLEAIRG